MKDPVRNLRKMTDKEKFQWKNGKKNKGTSKKKRKIKIQQKLVIEKL